MRFNVIYWRSWNLEQYFHGGSYDSLDAAQRSVDVLYKQVVEGIQQVSMALIVASKA